MTVAPPGLKHKTGLRFTVTLISTVLTLTRRNWFTVTLALECVQLPRRVGDAGDAAD